MAKKELSFADKVTVSTCYIGCFLSILSMLSLVYYFFVAILTKNFNGMFLSFLLLMVSIVICYYSKKKAQEKINKNIIFHVLISYIVIIITLFIIGIIVGFLKNF